MSIKVRKKIAVGALVFGISSAALAPAMAIVVGVGGGTWNYGTGSGMVWSNYHHPSKWHRSSVINGWGQYRTSGCVPAGYWSFASLRENPNAVDQAYWNDRC